MSVAPSTTTTYTLTATNAAGTAVTSTVTVTVVAAPSITSFVTSVATVNAGSTVNLTAIFGNGVIAVSHNQSLLNLKEGYTVVIYTTFCLYQLLT